ncbi:MAG: hypothetical protein ACRDDZ_05900 [Marinifilaceae bacterium]
MAQKTTISIDLPPHLEDFCRHELNPDDKGNIILRRSHCIGKVIHGNILTAEYPVKTESMKNKVLFVVPITPNNRYALSNAFLYISKWGNERIVDYIEACFTMRVRLFFEAGYAKNYRQKEIIEAFMQQYNITHTAINYETIKKYDYRTRHKMRKDISLHIESAVNQ